jgi:Cu/Zn superoxide dismutase
MKAIEKFKIKVSYDLDSVISEAIRALNIHHIGMEEPNEYIDGKLVGKESAEKHPNFDKLKDAHYRVYMPKNEYVNVTLFEDGSTRIEL